MGKILSEQQLRFLQPQKIASLPQTSIHNLELLVTIIIIFYNAERFFEETIESVLAQTYDRWELLLVDDGSSDASTRIAKDYESRYPEKIRYLHHPGHRNLGMSASRNLGIRHAGGVYLAFLDADDSWLSNTLEEQVECLDSHPEVALVCGPFQRWYSWTGNPEDLKRDTIQQFTFPTNTVIHPPALLAHFLVNEGDKPSGILVRRETVIKIGGFVEDFKGMYEDQAFWSKICLQESVLVTDRCWYRYRKHPDSCCSKTVNTGQYRGKRLAFLTWLKKYMSQQQIQDREVWDALHRELIRTGYPKLYRTWERIYPWVHSLKTTMSRITRRVLPSPVRQWLILKARGQPYFPPVGSVRLGSLGRVTPISRVWGFDRGTPVDRYYIEQFLSKNAMDIHGHVLEIGDETYTRQFGGERVSHSDVLHVQGGVPKVTIVADLASANHIPSNSFDCIIFTQTLQFIYDTRAALSTLERILAPGGVLLASVPGISPVSRSDMERWGHYWSFTTLSILRLMEDIFPTENIDIQSHGNVLAAAAFLYGLAAQELRQQDLETNDPDFQLLITIRALKPRS